MGGIYWQKITEKTIYLKIDLYEPTAEYSINGAKIENINSVYCENNAVLEIKTKDSIDKAPTAEYYVSRSETDADSIDGWNEYTEKVTLSSPGKNYVYIRATDKAGRKSKVYALTVTIAAESGGVIPPTDKPGYPSGNDSFNAVTAPSASNSDTAISESVAPEKAVTKAEPGDKIIVMLDDIFEDSDTTYSENGNTSQDLSESVDVIGTDGEQAFDEETAVGNENHADNPPKTGNMNSFSLMLGISAVSLVGIGGISLYNKKRKR